MMTGGASTTTISTGLTSTTGFSSVTAGVALGAAVAVTAVGVGVGVGYAAGVATAVFAAYTAVCTSSGFSLSSFPASFTTFWVAVGAFLAPPHRFPILISPIELNLISLLL